MGSVPALLDGALTVLVGTNDPYDDVVRAVLEDLGGHLERVIKQSARCIDPQVRAESGTGPGLAIVERIVTRHNGGAEVESERGVCTTFRVRLPGA